MVSLLQLGKGSVANFHIGVSGVFLYLDAGNQSCLVYNENTTYTIIITLSFNIQVSPPYLKGCTRGSQHFLWSICCASRKHKAALPTVFLTLFPAMEMFVTRCVLRINRKNVHQEMASLKPYIRTVSGKGIPSPEGAACSRFLTENGYHGA